MTDRMNPVPPDNADVAAVEEVDERQPEAVSVVAAVTVVSGVDPQKTLDAVASQDYSPTSVRLIGAHHEGAPAGVVLNEDVAAMVAGLDASVEYVWVLHGDAEPRPDALRALVNEAERFEASLAGSKLLVGGTLDTLESVGSATDVFGEPYSGLDEGEVDLEQYDVVRDVAFVSSVSLLVRRDLLRGLRGLDSDLAPVASGLDLSQRVRIAGGRVIVVPSSEVFHQRRCGRGDGGWREQSGRLRAMLKAYRPVTLLWMVPFALATGLLDSLASLLLGRWRLAPRYFLTWGWNVGHLPSTVAARRTLARVRQVGDEELFRYQVRGSVRLRQVGSELSDRLLTMFDEDSTVSRRATEVWNSASTWGILAALIVVLIGVRTIFLGGLPVVGYALPFGDPVTSLVRFAGGWNAAGLGTSAAVHPSTGPTALLNLLMLDNPEPARSLLTLVAFSLGVVGIGRLAARLDIGGPGAYLGGIAAMFGLPATTLATEGRWTALIGIGLLPWAMAAVVGPRPVTRRHYLGSVGWAMVALAAVTCFVPALAVVPLLFALAVAAIGRFPSRPLIASIATLGALVGVPYLLSRGPALLDGLPFQVSGHPLSVLVLAVTVLLAMVAGSWRAGAVAGVMIFGGLTLARVVGPDVQEALLAVAAVGVGLALGAALRPRPTRTTASWAAAVAGGVVLLISLAGVGGGRAGLPPDAWEHGLQFMTVDAEGVERALLISPEPDRLPGESRPGPGFWYRLIDTTGPTIDQMVLGPPDEGDVALQAAIEEIATGATLEPGQVLAPFAVRWLVSLEESAELVSPVLDAQLDLNSFPFVEDLLVYENTAVRPVAVTDQGVPWRREGTGFAGTPTDQRVRLAIAGNERWEPDWQQEDWAGTVDGGQGGTAYSRLSADRVTVLAGVVIVLAGLVLGVWGRSGRR
ncbi:MAG TPA: hypothetical protein VHL52_01790 [Acidimicrobiia bacterium]|nr:hypothetical protein [Acidimicrobiia bacterium]